MLLSTVDALTVDVCDCTQPRYAGVLSLAKLKNCAATNIAIRYSHVRFDLYIEQGGSRTFNGHVCRVWEKSKRVKEGIFWNTDTTFHEKYKAVAPAECWAMLQTGKCGEQALKKSGRVWSYYAEAVGEGSWNSISEFTATNCEVEEVTFEQECDSCPVLSVTGEVSNNRKIGYAVQGQKTFVWSDLVATKRNCEMRRSERRSGQLYNVSGVLKLRDCEHQMDFLLGGIKKTCDPELGELWSVKGEEKLFIALHEVDERKTFANQRRPRRAITLDSTKSVVSIPVLTIEEYIPKHLQYIRDTLVKQETRFLMQ